MSDMDKETVRLIVEEVLIQAPPRKETIKETVHETLTELGIDHSEPMEMQKDFQHLREARITMDQVRSRGILTLLGFLITGIVAAIWLGIKTFFNVEL